MDMGLALRRRPTDETVSRTQVSRCRRPRQAGDRLALADDTPNSDRFGAIGQRVLPPGCDALAESPTAPTRPNCIPAARPPRAAPTTAPGAAPRCWAQTFAWPAGQSARPGATAT